LGETSVNKNGTEAPADERKINNLEDVHCVRDAAVAGTEGAAEQFTFRL
jgi:hypothetical protein